MLDFIYYPVSFILWCWHWVFAHILGDSNFIGWALSIVFLVFTLRLVMLKPAIHQVRSMRKMQQFAPEMKKIQKKYANDRQRQAQEMQKLQREHGVNPLGGCLPMLLQIPVFIGLNHVLRSFREGTTEVYFFKAHDVHSYLAAKLFGAHLGDAVLGIGSMGGTPGWHWDVAPVAIPLMIAASIATHFTARLSVQRQLAMGAPGTAQTAMMNKLTMYIFPLGVLVFGFGFPVGLLLYWLSNNAWTLAQQHLVMQRMDREEDEQKAKAQETRQALAPKPGQKPTQPRNRRPAGGNTGAKQSADDGDQTESPATKPPTSGNAGRKRSGNNRPRVNDATPKQDAVPKQDATPGKSGRSASAKANSGSNGSTEIPGLISDRSRRKKQDRKRG